jgi:hypothetical protein
MAGKNNNLVLFAYQEFAQGFTYGACAAGDKYGCHYTKLGEIQLQAAGHKL